MRKQYSYDPACEMLAEHFVDHPQKPEDVQALAQHIQDAVEDWLRDNERPSKAQEPS